MFGVQMPGAPSTQLGHYFVANSGGLDATDPNAAMGFANAMKDLPAHTNKGGTLYVFNLSGGSNR